MYVDNARSEPLVLDVRTVPALRQDEPAVRAAPDTCPSPHSRSEGTCDHGKILIVKENELAGRNQQPPRAQQTFSRYRARPYRQITSDHVE